MFLFSQLSVFLLTSVLLAQIGVADYEVPFPPHQVIANIYYVGSKGLASYLITTSQGHILINSNLESSVPMIKDSVEKLGFRFADIKILLISHAHYDHNGGSARLRRLTGARYFVMAEDADEVEAGGKGNFHYGDTKHMLYEPCPVDRRLHDGDVVELGEARLVAHRTPGHTRGCTTWTLRVKEGGKNFDVVVVGSPNVNPGYKLVNNKAYPEIARDFQRTFQVLKSLPCDVFLGAHGSYYGLEAKFARKIKSGGNPFVDPTGYKDYILEREASFQAELDKQSKGH